MRKIFPYELSPNWQRTTLKNVCELSNGEKLFDKKLPYLDVKYLRGKSQKNLVENGNYIAKGSKIILVDGENSGEIFTVFENGYMGSTLRALKILEYVDADFFQYFISTKKELYRKNKKGSAIPHLNKNLFYSTLFPLPPLDEQKRIVAILETLFSKLDAAKSIVQKVLDGYELRRAAILHKAFTGELSKKFRAENNLSLDDWQEKKLGEVIKLLSGQDFKSKDYNSLKIGIPYIIGASNFKNTHVLINRWTEKPTVLAKFGDVLLVCKGSGHGKAIIADFPIAHIARQIMALRPNKELCNRLVYYFLQFKNNDLKDSGQGLIPGISRKVVLNLKINLPPIEEQKEIVRVLDSLLDKEQRTKDLAENILHEIELLKKSILARAFRGELGTNNLLEKLEGSS